MTNELASHRYLPTHMNVGFIATLSDGAQSIRAALHPRLSDLVYSGELQLHCVVVLEEWSVVQQPPGGDWSTMLMVRALSVTIAGRDGKGQVIPKAPPVMTGLPGPYAWAVAAPPVDGVAPPDSGLPAPPPPQAAPQILPQLRDFVAQAKETGSWGKALGLVWNSYASSGEIASGFRVDAVAAAAGEHVADPLLVDAAAMGEAYAIIFETEKEALGNALENALTSLTQTVAAEGFGPARPDGGGRDLAPLVVALENPQALEPRFARLLPPLFSALAAPAAKTRRQLLCYWLGQSARCGSERYFRYLALLKEYLATQAKAGTQHDELRKIVGLVHLFYAAAHGPSGGPSSAVHDIPAATSVVRDTLFKCAALNDAIQNDFKLSYDAYISWGPQRPGDTTTDRRPASVNYAVAALTPQRRAGGPGGALCWGSNGPSLAAESLLYYPYLLDTATKEAVLHVENKMGMQQEAIAAAESEEPADRYVVLPLLLLLLLLLLWSLLRRHVSYVPPTPPTTTPTTVALVTHFLLASLSGTSGSRCTATTSWKTP